MKEPYDLPIADVRKRLIAFVIDDMFISLLFFIIFYDQIVALFAILSAEQQPDAQALTAAMNQFVAGEILPLFALKVLYHTVPVWQNGKTLGKYVMKIRVVSLQSASNPSFVTAFTRAILRIPSELLFYLGFVMAFFVPLKQTFHDKFSQCVVVDG